MLGDGKIDQADEGGMKSVFICVGDTMGPDEVKVTKPLDYWVEPAPNTTIGGPSFDKVDNPGGWNRFSYFPSFLYGAQGGHFKFHFIPSGCQTIFQN